MAELRDTTVKTHTYMIPDYKRDVFLILAKRTLEDFDKRLTEQPFALLGECQTRLRDAVDLLEKAKPTATETYYPTSNQESE